MDHKKLNRRDFFRKVALPAAATAATAGFLPATGCGKSGFTKNPDIPNIIFITADNLGWYDLSCYGNKNVKTPGTDRIAAGGVRFTSAFVVSSSCAPSRASFLTGQYPHTHGVTALTHLKKTKALSPFAATLPKLLRDAGYNTAMQGKWHESPYLPTSWYGFNERLSGMMTKDWHIRDIGRAVDFIKRNKSNRFYLQMNFINNHRDPYGEYYYDKDFPVDPTRIKVPPYMAMPDWPEIREDLARYYSQSLRMEKLIGDLLNELEKLGLTDNTLVMFTSDNGPHYPGMISSLYDRGVGVPLIVRWPGKVKPGTSITHMINSIDIMPTLLEAAGVAVHPGVQGKSFLPMLKNPKAPPLHEQIFMEIDEHVYHIPTRVVRTKEWKYIRNYSDTALGLDQNNHMEWAHRMCELPNHPWKRPRQREELYNVGKDPNEQINLAANPNYAGRLEELRKMLDDHMKKTGDLYLGREFAREFNAENYKPIPPGTKYW
ncbi:MAG TPA: hypothetical protein ENN21_09655 [Spirochaetes bacterium]|mgnify:CR=1 FL=1|nr:hypothetical protein [Spirochaetota bacterium]